MSPDLTYDPAQNRIDDIAVDRLVERIGREATRHVDTHKNDLQAEALTAAAADLRARAETADVGDPLVAALLSGCHTVGGVVVADPTVIARAAYLAVAALLDRSPADGGGQHRTPSDETTDPRTETNPHG